MYLPFVLLLWGFLTGGSWELPVMGMAIGHLVYYLEIQYPAKYGRKLIPTPKFIENWFPNSVGVHGVNGPVQPTRTTRDAWGTGHRLGTQ
jgi:hypothetical protein